jgi:hypothetical protein
MADKGTATPPYGSFANFWGFLEEMSQRGPAPQVLERAVYGGRSEAGRWEIQNALQFFGLIDAGKRPTATGKLMIEHPDADTLGTLIKELYPSVIELGLENATPGQVDDVLKSMGLRDGGTLRKGRTFFLHAAHRAGIPIGPHLKTPVGVMQRPRRSKPSRPAAQPPVTPPSPPSPDLKTRYVELLMSKVEQQEDPDKALLDRIERALEIGAAANSALEPQTVESPVVSRRGDADEPPERE